MSPQSKVKLEEAKWTEWDKKRNSARFKMLELQSQIEFVKECITLHEKFTSQDTLSEEAKKINENIINDFKKTQNYLLKKASNL